MLSKSLILMHAKTKFSRLRNYIPQTSEIRDFRMFRKSLKNSKNFWSSKSKICMLRFPSTYKKSKIFYGCEFAICKHRKPRFSSAVKTVSFYANTLCLSASYSGYRKSMISENAKLKLLLTMISKHSNTQRFRVLKIGIFRISLFKKYVSFSLKTSFSRVI